MSAFEGEFSRNPMPDPETFLGDAENFDLISMLMAEEKAKRSELREIVRAQLSFFANQCSTEANAGLHSAHSVPGADGYSTIWIHNKLQRTYVAISTETPDVVNGLMALDYEEYVFADHTDNFNVRTGRSVRSLEETWTRKALGRSALVQIAQDTLLITRGKTNTSIDAFEPKNPFARVKADTDKGMEVGRQVEATLNKLSGTLDMLSSRSYYAPGVTGRYW